MRLNPFVPTVPTFAVRETDVSRYNGGTRGAPIMPRDVCLSDSKCWNGGQKWVKSIRLDNRIYVGAAC